jgi:hypothetical protein
LARVTVLGAFGFLPLFRSKDAEAASISVAEAMERILGKENVVYASSARGILIIGLGGTKTQSGKSGLIYTTSTSPNAPMVPVNQFKVSSGIEIRWWLVTGANQGAPRLLGTVRVP